MFPVSALARGLCGFRLGSDLDQVKFYGRWRDGKGYWLFSSLTLFGKAEATGDDHQAVTIPKLHTIQRVDGIEGFGLGAAVAGKVPE